MKPSIAETATRRLAVGNAENRKWRVGVRVERELDGLWFSATIVRCGDDGSFEIEYDEDQNRETDITEDELRLEGDGAGRDEPLARPQTSSGGGSKSDLLLRSGDSLLLQPPDYDPNKAPTVVLHHRGESHAAASAYIINGLENNIAAGNGLRGIRWLRVNTL